MKPTLLSLLVGLAIGCGGGAQNADPKQPQPEAHPPVATQPAPPPADPNAITSDDDYIAKASGFITRMLDVFKADGKDCDKLADDLDKIHTDAAPLKAYEKAHPDVEKKLAEALKSRQQEMINTMTPGGMACQSNEHFAKVMSEFN